MPLIQDRTEEETMYGTPGIHLAGRVVYDPAKHGEALPCPFCGSDDLELNNTHTPYYWISCECGAEIHGDNLKGADGAIQTQEEFVRYNDFGIKDTIEKWNRRPMEWAREVTEPGDYWFAFDQSVIDLYTQKRSVFETGQIEERRRLHYRKVCRDSEGKLFVANVGIGGWGPDGRYSAINHNGWWSPITSPPLPPDRTTPFS